MFEHYDLTDRFHMKFDVERMRKELHDLENENWLSHYDEALADGWTTIPLVSHDGSADNAESQRIGKWGEYKRTRYVEKLPYFREILDAFACPHGRIRIMKLMPGSIIKEHRDTYSEVSDYAFGQVRLHIPIVTNDKVKFIVNGHSYHLKEGRLYYVNFSKKHYVRNDGDKPRTHLVLDVKVNDFLASIFPKLTPYQKLECFFSRLLIPIFIWHPKKNYLRAMSWFWKNYNGSRLQALRHRLLPKRNLS
ncbi:aspartyl/asparaginyl beta-hydroxylase domain-containing protein [Marinobacter sp.]|uniref:aspartyl/asparaginyl beta-hydroxylase domain-containing protein n=1 Tax=Marinobacter sp. TaxID=50741 RepID=UPI000C95EBE6|nr:aspartyl/asparaginyl beta-hydroxylase domain-containing protein [Marinobacter sp.]MAC24600.1 hypothetical protein [Marinobacter sp.]HAC87614.1 hypothetical protein [Gammaproteobacteria bacterium]